MKKMNTSCVVFSFLALFILSACNNKDAGEKKPVSNGAPSGTTPQSSGPPPQTEVPVVVTENKPPIPPTPPKKKIEYKTVLQCQYKGNNDKKEHGPDRCIAAAQICNSCGLTEDHSKEYCHNELTVLCDGQKVYSDGFKHTTMNGYNYLIGASHSISMVMLVYPDSHSDHYPTVIPSWIKLGNEQLDGSCEINKVEETEKAK